MKRPQPTGSFTLTSTPPTPAQLAAFKATVRRLMQPIPNQSAPAEPRRDRPAA